MKLTESTKPISKSQLISDLKALEIKEGDTIIVHSSLSSIGYVLGGTRAVIESLMEVVTNSGNLVMPTHSSTLTDPMHWRNPPIPKEWWSLYREESPAFDPKLTPCEWMGQIPELFRLYPGVKRSNHPSHSFAAWGSQAEFITSDHSLENSFGMRSPLQKVYELNGKILLIGVDHDSNTSLHLAESLFESFPTEIQGAPMLIDGIRTWVEFKERQYDNDDFLLIGRHFEKDHHFRRGSVGQANSKVFNQKVLVDFAFNDLKKLRNLTE